MREVMPEAYAWQERNWEEIYTVTFVRGLDERETLRRFGVADDDIGPADKEEVMERIEETDGCCDMVLAARSGDWTIAFEYSGWEGTRPETLRELTRDGGEAVAVMRHDYAASHRFQHAADGRIRTAFRPQWPQERWGSHPDTLNDDMRALGLEPEPDKELGSLPGPVSVSAALALASRISGVLFTPAMLDGPLLGGIITDPAPEDPPTGDPLTTHTLRSFNREMAEAIDGASPDLQRRASIAEARRQCTLAGVADHPVLTEALARAEQGQTPQVADDSPLAKLIRIWESDLTGQPIDTATGEWSVDSCEQSHRSPGGLYSVTFVDATTGMPTCPTCTPRRYLSEEERDAARPRWQAASAVRDALSPDARKAAYDIHLALVSADRIMADPDHATAVIATLRAGEA
ncbi:hypothetical protein HS048_34275 [Planomonospora sp. ID91781]|uniref:DUF6461 domain-containing protein n=1 Tax=Planomonospora sp. ID91781 TaxID=2738135 RepID=UPI0018C3AFD6|nr:DUF6461 domain-containing protein [Planomonospora sp. ID91781]MBG0825753.1 hypothetical protein [Planomonospora sp. ID91781]